MLNGHDHFRIRVFTHDNSSQFKFFQKPNDLKIFIFHEIHSLRKSTNKESWRNYKKNYMFPTNKSIAHSINKHRISKRNVYEHIAREIL